MLQSNGVRTTMISSILCGVLIQFSVSGSFLYPFKVVREGIKACQTAWLIGKNGSPIICGWYNVYGSYKPQTTARKIALGLAVSTVIAGIDTEGCGTPFFYALMKRFGMYGLSHGLSHMIYTTQTFENPQVWIEARKLSAIDMVTGWFDQAGSYCGNIGIKRIFTLLRYCDKSLCTLPNLETRLYTYGKLAYGAILSNIDKLNVSKNSAE